MFYLYQMAFLSSFLQMFIVIGMYNFVLNPTAIWGCFQKLKLKRAKDT